jgi:hypothetical protein
MYIWSKLRGKTVFCISVLSKCGCRGSSNKELQNFQVTRDSVFLQFLAKLKTKIIEPENNPIKLAKVVFCNSSSAQIREYIQSQSNSQFNFK